MKTNLMIAGALLVPASAAIAQTAPQPIARADYVKRIDTRFGAMDVNHDGVITQAELTAELQREVQSAQAKIREGLAQRFKQLDTNKDGQLNMQEFAAIASAPRASESPAQVLARLDANHDGKISGDEYRNPELTKFNRVDANHDGVVTPDEMKATASRK